MTRPDPTLTQIEAAMYRLGMTQSELARRAGTSQPAVAAWFAGRKQPGVHTVRRLAEAVGLDLTTKPQAKERTA